VKGLRGMGYILCTHMYGHILAYETDQFLLEVHVHTFTTSHRIDVYTHSHISAHSQTTFSQQVSKQVEEGKNFALSDEYQLFLFPNLR